MTWLNMTSGHGPGECEMAIAHLLPVLEREAEAEGEGVSVSVLDAEETKDGFKSILLELSGETADVFSRSWEGSVLWRWQSKLRPKHRRRNWFVGISRVEKPSATGRLREQDVDFEACRSSGPGGQHVNKTNSAVRATHRPTGVSVFVQTERSQHRNKSIALARISAALAEHDEANLSEAGKSRWQEHAGLERGNPVRTYEGDRFRLVR